jgi:hypothetical protein
MRRDNGRTSPAQAAKVEHQRSRILCRQRLFPGGLAIHFVPDDADGFPDLASDGDTQPRWLWATSEIRNEPTNQNCRRWQATV